MKFDTLSNRVIGCAIEVHRQPGRGLLESTYEQCLAHELKLECSWEGLNTDLRQPNTFLITVDRFIELNGIDVEKVKYSEVMDEVYEFDDEKLAQAFREYHCSKATLRLVKRKRNLSRLHQAKLRRQGKDLVIEKKQC